jgi:hypothetical protein
VVDALRAAGLDPVPVTITAGQAVTVGDGGYRRVPKADLVACLAVLLQTGRLKIARALPLARALVEELKAFEIHHGAAGRDTYGAWREGTHDDLVLAVAVAAGGRNGSRHTGNRTGRTTGDDPAVALPGSGGDICPTSRESFEPRESLAMNARSNRNKQALAYQRFRDKLMTILYEEDPGGMGSTVGAPLDEYAQEASRLVPRLRVAAASQEVRLILEDMFHNNVSDSLASRVERALRDFARDTADDDAAGKKNT